MASDRSGQRVVLRAHPQGAIQPSDFAVEALSLPEIRDGEFLVRALYISVDPMLRLFVDKAPLGGSMPGLPEGATVPGAAVGEVVESRHPGFAAGDVVEGRLGWQSLAVSGGAGIRKVNPKLGPPETALGIAGLPGFTAYVGLDVAGVKPGQTVLVSGAAGAVGSMVGALVRARGGRAVGIAGGEGKRAYLADVGYEAVADRLSPDFEAQLAAALPNGADVYFDNVGGPLLAKVIPHVARGGLVLISGLMAQYQGEAGGGGSDDLPAVLRAVMGRQVRIQGFTQFGRDAMRPAFEEELGTLVADGKIASAIHVEQGIERLPHALAGLFENSQTGKVVVKVA